MLGRGEYNYKCGCMHEWVNGCVWWGGTHIYYICYKYLCVGGGGGFILEHMFVGVGVGRWVFACAWVGVCPSDRGSAREVMVKRRQEEIILNMYMSCRGCYYYE